MCCSCGSNLRQSEHRKICTCRKRSGVAFSKTTLFDPPPSFTAGVSAGTEKNEGTEAQARCWHQAHRSWTGFLHAFLPVHINLEPQCPLSFQLLILSLNPSIYTFWAGVSFLMCQFYTSISSWMSLDLLLAHSHQQKKRIRLLASRYRMEYPLSLGSVNTPFIPIFLQSVPTHSSLLLIWCCTPKMYPTMLLLKLCQGQCIPAASSMLSQSGINSSRAVFLGTSISQEMSISSL